MSAAPGVQACTAMWISDSGWAAFFITLGSDRAESARCSRAASRPAESSRAGAGIGGGAIAGAATTGDGDAAIARMVVAGAPGPAACDTESFMTGAGSFGKSLSHHACTAHQRSTSESRCCFDCAAFAETVARRRSSYASRSGPRGGVRP